MRLTGSRAYAKPPPTPTMPPGLVELMEGLAKDVLKNNPENIYEFCAGHIQKLLEIRDGSPPPKKQLSLEQKIAKAQEKIRQRIRDRQIQQDKIMLERSSENQEHDNKQHVEIPTQDLHSTLQPVVHGEGLVMANDAEIFHEPYVAITTKDITTEEAVQIEDEVKTENVVTQKVYEKETKKLHGEGVTDNSTSEDINQLSDNKAVETELSHVDATQKLESKESTVKINGEVQETICDDLNKIPEFTGAVATEHEIKEDIAVTQKSESKESAEKVIEEVKQNTPSDNAIQIPDIEPIVETKNIVNINQASAQSNDAVEHAEKVAQIKENEEIQFVESKPVVNMIANSAEEKTVTLEYETLGKDVIKHELNALATTEPLTNNSETKLSHINENETQVKDIIEENKIIKKEELTALEHDDILIEKDVIYIKPVDSVDTIYSNEQKKGEQNSEALSPISELTIPHETGTQLDGSQLKPSTNTETSDIISNLEVSVKHNMLEDKVITVDIAEKTIIDDDPLNNEEHRDAHDVHKNEIKYVSNVDKQLIDNNDKLPEQERADSGEFVVKQNNVIHDDSTDKNNKNFENDETTENTAVSGMDLETAAITIQKVFRTFLFSKSRASTLDDTVNENSLDEDIEKKDEPQYVLTSANLNKERRTGLSRMDTVLQTVNEEKSMSLSDDSSLSSAATTIQAHVRGFLVRNRLASNITASSSSLVNSDGPSTLSLDGDANEPKKTILNIHIVPERGQFMSRDESLLTSIDLPLDNSPPSSINLHPLGYDKSERRKQLKREDAVQSISPPSNNSGKLSEEVDSVKDVLNESVDSKQESGSISENGHNNGLNNEKLESKIISEDDYDKPQEGNTVKQENDSISVNGHDIPHDADTESCDTTLTISSTAETVVDAETYHTREILSSPEHIVKAHENVTNSSSDEMDVVTPFPTITQKAADTESDEKPKLVHSGEFHDIVVQTQVKRTESSVVREFKNVLVYFLLWDKT